MSDNLDAKDTGIQNKEDAQSCVKKVEKFVTNIWEHPLVTPETRTHREIAKTILADILASYGVDETSFCTLPVGGLIWTVTEKSDFDYTLFFRSCNDMIIAKNKLYAKGNKVKFGDRLKSDNIHFVGNFPAFAVENFQIPSHEEPLFLLTPDDYIGGNKELARTIRLKIIERANAKPERQSLLEEDLKTQFDVFFRCYDDPHVDFAELYRGPGNKKDRRGRIIELLEQRSKQTHSPERYKQAFLKAKEEIEIPDLNTYKRAIIETQGSLQISPRFVAQGLTPK